MIKTLTYASLVPIPASTHVLTPIVQMGTWWCFDSVRLEWNARIFNIYKCTRWSLCMHSGAHENH